MSALLDGILARVDKHGLSTGNIEKAIAYLKKYGYLAKTNELGIVDVAHAVLEFCEFFHIKGHNPEDVLSPKILTAMDAQRCGFPDVLRERTEESKWGVRELSYFIKDRDSDLSAGEWDDIMAQACGQWAAVCNLKFSKALSQSSANFILDIGSGPADQFDGPSGTLAWAQLPGGNNFNGQLLMKFDRSETWITNPLNRGILLLNVATHEWGHLLGLEHSKIQSALMAPYYSVNITKPQANDDIPRIQALYGPAISPPPTPTPTPTPDPTPTPGKQIITIEINGSVNSASIPGFRVLAK